MSQTDREEREKRREKEMDRMYSRRKALPFCSLDHRFSGDSEHKNES